MYPLHIAFSGYALIGLTLFLLASTLAIYLVRLPTKSYASRYLIAFFAAVALSGLASILSNAFLYWDRLFVPWQDFWILIGGVALSQFAYAFPRHERTREATVVLLLTTGVALLGLAYSLYFTVRFLSSISPAPGVSDLYYLLLPLDTLFIVLLFLRRSLHYARRARQGTDPVRSVAWWSLLFSPQGRDARALRNLALALSLAFLPGVQTLAHFPSPYGFVFTNIGSLLAITAIALVYFNTSAETTSFLAKLVGITLAIVLLIFSIVGSLDIYRTDGNYGAAISSAVAAVSSQLVETGRLITAPSTVIYVASWDTARPDDPARYRLLFPDAEDAAAATRFDLNELIAENGEGYLATRWSWSLGDSTGQFAGDTWRRVWRFRTYPVGSDADYDGYIFADDGITYEIGFSILERRDYLSEVVVAWMALVVGSTVMVLLVFPFFFRTTLVRPLQDLLAGMTRVNSGDLDTTVPIHFNDEIGFLTRSFNNMTQTLQQAQVRQQELLAELRLSYEELETRIADRTRELSAFADLTRLAGGDEPVEAALQPALTRVLETGLCQALCVHLLSADETCLQLVAQRHLPESSLESLQSIPLSGSFAARVHNAYDFWSNPRLTDLPPALQIPELESYLGAPLDVGGRSHGWMSFYREADEAFHTSEASLLAAVARQIGVIAENHQLRQRIAEIAVVEERQRLARDLHDSATQLLYSLTLFSRASVDALEAGDTVRLQTNLEQMEHTSLQALRELRSLLFELQPVSLKDTGLMQALRNRFDIVERRVGIQVDFQPLTLPLPERSERALFFVAVEALNNVLKHAGASSVSLAFRQSDTKIEMSIVDDGVGFTTEQHTGGLGLVNMQERVAQLHGTLTITSTPGQGTRVVARLPMSGAG